MRAALIVTSIAATCALTACGSSATPNRSAPTAHRAATISLLSGDVVVTPADHAHAALTWAQARAHCRNSGCNIGKSPKVVLGRAVTPRDPQGTPLSYIAITHQKCASAGPYPSIANCVFVQLIDANTGVIGYTEDGSVD